MVAFAFFEPRAERKKLEFSLRSPFDPMIDRPDRAGWLGDLEAFRTLCIAPPAEMKVLMEDAEALERVSVQEWKLTYARHMLCCCPHYGGVP